MSNASTRENVTHTRYFCTNCHKEFVPDPGQNAWGFFCSYDCEYSYMSRQSESAFINWYTYTERRFERELVEHEHENN